MSSLQDKLLNCEVPPPSGVWDKIAAALDEPVDEKQDYANRLYELEMTPPKASWGKIEAALDADVKYTAPVRKIPFLRYAAAAVLIGAIAIGVFKWTSPAKNEGIANNTTVAQKTSVPVSTTPATAITDGTTKENDSAKEHTQDNYVALDRIGKINMKKALAMSHYTGSSDENTGRPVYAYEDYVPDLADRYVMLMTPEGSIIRMSKKLGDLICCVSGEEQDNDCKDQLKKWQEKLATSSLAPSPGNFLDILSLVNSLNDTEL